MTRRSQGTGEGPGQDSFLDIMANIVGVLIILVMVVGARTQHAYVSAATARREPAADNEPLPDIEGKEKQVFAIADAIRDQRNQMKQLQAELGTSYQQRAELQTLVAAIEATLEKEREKLDNSQQAEFDAQRALDESERKLRQLTNERQSIDDRPPPPQVIRHLPTPLATTVFGREEHFRLLDGRLCYVPMNDLVDRLKSEAPEKLWKLKQAQAITETIGPLEGFRMQYTLERTERIIETRVGRGRREMLEFTGFVLVPVASNLGEPLEQALQPNSQLFRRLAQWDPNTTTITVWTYPNSFDQFRTLKETLHHRGYLTAGRPMPAGQLIAGGPTGSKSAAQ